MRAVVQRSDRASCTVDEKVTGEIPYGLVLLVSIDPEDTDNDIEWMGNKVSGLRIFPDSDGKMNLSLLDLQEKWESIADREPESRPGILSISQFTLHGKARKGFRPSFTGAASPEMAEIFYGKLNDDLSLRGLRIEEGVFGAMMDISLINKGPVTILIDSKHNF